MKRLYTSNYARRGSDPRAISISIAPPRWYPKLTHYAPLAPSRDLVSEFKMTYDVEAYTAIYEAQLAKLDPAQVVADLPEDSILLCYEKPTDFCHRQLVAKWLNESGLAIVTEMPSKKEMEILARKSPRAVDPDGALEWGS